MNCSVCGCLVDPATVHDVHEDGCSGDGCACDGVVCSWCCAECNDLAPRPIPPPGADSLWAWTFLAAVCMFSGWVFGWVVSVLLRRRP